MGRPPDNERGPETDHPRDLDNDSEPGTVSHESTQRVSKERATCWCAQAHGDLTPLAWRTRHGVDVLALRERRAVTEIAALKSGRRIIDLGPEWMAS
jgi:hypothetical protein